MANFATALKDEIARVARKDSKGEMLKLKKTSAQHRSEIAALKRRIQSLEQQIKRLGKASGGRAAAAAQEEGAEGPALRFSAKGLATQRKRLGLSAAAVAQLLGVSGQSIYKWEDGKTRPRASQIAAIATLRTMSKKQAAARLEELAGS